MCIRVDANGWGDGAGTHVSVHVYRMQGAHDYELYKKNTYSITIQLVNHKNEQDQHKKTVHGLLYNHGRETEDKTIIGYGIPQFIAHDDVESSTETRMYLVNDCMTWRVCYINLTSY